MNLEIRRFAVPFWVLWSLALSIATAISVYLYWQVDASDAKLLGFVGGVAAGLFVYLLTFATLLPPIYQLDRFRQMGINALLANRHDQAYYRKLISSSRLRVDVMGASCNRFVRDFLDVDSDDKVLVDGLGKHVNLKVRILIPSDNYLSVDARNRFAGTLAQIEAVKRRFPGRIELRRFDEEARHSFVITDKDLVAGPVFAGNQSRHAPAVHVDADTPFGQKYSAFFDREWERFRGTQG